MDTDLAQRRSGGASLAAKCLWICALSFQYGYNISALNSLSNVLSCSSATTSSWSWLPTCFAMNANQYGLVTSIYTLGGLAGSLFTGTIADKHGRRAACVAGACSIAVGGLIMGLAVNFAMLVIGRAVVGIGCGVATVIVPTFLSEIAPSDQKGRIGVLNQVGIVTGIFTGQCASILFAHSTTWRFVPVCTAALAIAQIILAPGMPESPVWLGQISSATPSDREQSPSRIYQADDDEGSRDRLLETEEIPQDSNEGQHGGSVSRSPPQTISGVITSPLTRKGLRIVIITQIAQQASGINAVMYYSTDIMKSVLPTSSAYIALTITAVNIVMTFPPLFMIDRVGRRPLLLLSIGSMGLSSLLLSLTIKQSPVIASIAVVAFVASFSIGLGPIPFLIIPEVVPKQSAAATASLGLALNWLVNFIVGAIFWPLSNALGQEAIFVGFALVAVAATVLVGGVYQ